MNDMMLDDDLLPELNSMTAEEWSRALRKLRILVTARDLQVLAADLDRGAQEAARVSLAAVARQAGVSIEEVERELASH